MEKDSKRKAAAITKENPKSKMGVQNEARARRFDSVQV
jgi:hypothetical protein